MAYADQQMSGNRMIAIVIVALLHVAIGYTLVTGLAYEAAKAVVERVTTVDVDEPEPEEEPPPPPEEVPETAPPPMVIPQPRFENTTNTATDTTDKPLPRDDTPSNTATTQTCPDGRVIAASASCGPATKTCPDGKSYPINATCPEVKKAVPPKPPKPKGNPGRWVTPNDYPSRALREEQEGVTTVRLTVDAGGKVTGCSVTGSSGSPLLDDTTCKKMQQRAKFDPATDGDGRPVASTYTQSVKWEIPQ